MGVYGGPEIPNDGLVLALDGANYKSFKGSVATNILNQITYNFGNTDTALFKNIQGSENVNIPSLGYVNSKYVDFYNDYGGGSGNCCPNPFTYGNGLSVSGNTQYTYSIIYKTTSGYTHPNYMYHYEYGPNGYITEYGVHDTGNRTSLGDGWYHAWGQFTTNAAATSINTGMWHYEYATQNRIYVYKAALYAGTYVIPPEHMLNSGEVRGSTVAAGGGWADLTGNVNNGELVNGPTYSSANGGSLVFDGTDDYVYGTVPYTGNTNVTITGFAEITLGTAGCIIKVGDGCAGYSMGIGGNYFSDNGNNIVGLYSCIRWISTGVSWNSGWNGFAMVIDGSGNASFYKNGFLVASSNGSAPAAVSGSYYLGRCVGDESSGSERAFEGKLASVKIYNRALTAAEISQNFNALRGRFGI